MKYTDAMSAFIMDRQASGIRPASITFYEYVLDRFYRFNTTDDLEAARVQIVPYFAHMRTTELSEATIHAQMRGLRAFFRWCAEYEMCEPARMPRLRKPKKSPDPLTPDEITTIIKHFAHGSTFGDRRDAALVRFFFDTGCRLNEALGVDMHDIDWQKRNVHIVRKGGKEQVVPFGRHTLRSLRDYLPHRAKYAPRYESALWVTHHGTRLKDSSVRTRFRSASDATGIHLHPHRLRHSFAVAWIMNGGDAFTLQAILGHESQEMTARYVKIAGQDVSTQHDRHSPGDRI